MHVSNEPVAINKMKQFHEILCATGGRYTSNPRLSGDVYRVDYTYEDIQAYKKFCDAWNQLNTSIVEIRRDQWWRKMLRRTKYLVNFKPQQA